MAAAAATLAAPIRADIMGNAFLAALTNAGIPYSEPATTTALGESVDPEALRALLAVYFERMKAIVETHGGTVDKFIGDAVMAVFGIPEQRETMAADAVGAALEMRDALDAINMRHRFLGSREIRVGIGIDQGEAVIGFIGSHLRQSYTAIGDVVNTASRLESATKEAGCDILISQSTDEAQRRYRVAETAYLGLAALKGKEAPVPVYQVLGPHEVGDLRPGLVS